MSDIHKVLARLKNVKQAGEAQWACSCPAHNDANPSLTVSLADDGRILLRCHAGCSFEEIRRAMGLEARDFAPNSTEKRAKQKRRIVATYDYPHAQKVRYDPKSFSWRHLDEDGAWIYNRKGIPHELYIRGNEQQIMFFVEGEKDVDNLSSLGFYVACNEDGADKNGNGKWFDGYNEPFRGKDVRIVIDNDETGRNFSPFVASKLLDIAKSIKLFDLNTVWSDCPEHGDISDMLSALGKDATLENLKRLEASAPLFTGKTELETIQDKPKELPNFYRDGKFLHNIFGDYLIEHYGCCIINDAIHIYDNGIYKPGAEAAQGIMLELLPELSAAKRKEVYEYLKVSRHTPHLELSPPNYIPFKSKIYNIDTDEFIEYSRDYVFLNRFPFDYKPDAPYCESVSSLLYAIADGDDDIVTLLCETFGNCFYMLNSYRGAVFLYGRSGNNGKSTLLNMLIQLLGKENVSSLSLQDTAERFRLIGMYGKAANIGDDISAAYFPESSIFKKLVTGEYVKAEKKGQDPIDFRNYAKIFFALNELPPIKDKSEAFFSRILLIPLNHDFSKEKDVSLKDKRWSQSEMEYLTRLAMDGLKRLIKNGDFIKPQRTVDALNEFEKENDPILLFLDDEVDRSGIIGKSTQEVYDEFCLWCYKNGHKNIPAKINFSRRICQRLHIQARNERVYGKQIKIYRNAG